jgi:hypothetical protein
MMLAKEQSHQRIKQRNKTLTRKMRLLLRASLKLSLRQINNSAIEALRGEGYNDIDRQNNDIVLGWHYCLGRNVVVWPQRQSNRIGHLFMRFSIYRGHGRYIWSIMIMI